MRHQRHAIGVALAAVMLLSVAVYAQNSRWAKPYQDGVKAAEAKKWAEAVALIEQAVAVNPKAERQKLIEGVFRVDYFPYLYLGMAYMELGQFEKAQQNLEKAKNPAPTDRRLQGLNATYLARLQDSLGSSKKPAPAVVAAVNPAFAPALQRAEASFAARRYADALGAYDAAKGADAAEYSKQNLQAKRDETARTYALQLADEGRQSLGESASAARGKFQQADQVFPGLKETSDGLAELRRRDDQYAQLKSGAEQDISANTTASLRTALAKLDQAKAAQPEQFTTDNLVARVNFVNGRLNAPIVPAPVVQGGSVPAPADPSKGLLDAGRLLASQGKYTEAEASYSGALQRNPSNLDAKAALDASRKYAALVNEGRSLKDKRGSAPAARKSFEDARTLDSQRFERDALGPVLTALLKDAGVDPAKEGLRQGLLALLKGDAQGSIAILQPALEQAGSGDAGAVALHAYLGVAYATRALSSSKPDDQTRLNGFAVEQFKLAVASQRNYQLSPRIVSPKIIAIFEQARR